MKDYRKKNPDYEYTITFDERNHQVNIHLCKDGERYIPQANGNTVGIDVNCKHNLFSYRMKQFTTMTVNSSMISVNYLMKLTNLKQRIKNTKSVNVNNRNLILSNPKWLSLSSN